MKNWLNSAESISTELLQIYRDFHRHPELGNEEHRTTERIQEILESLGLKTYSVTDTGIIGYLECVPGADAVAFRADIDALPVQEETGVPYASEIPGRMHACGHDLHTTALLGAAQLLAGRKSELTRNVVFIFQPDEEGDGGAQRILDTGILDQLRVKTIFGAHVNPDLPAGSVGIKYGRFYASACVFDVTVHGRGSHGAEPEKGTDSLYAAAKMCAKLKELTGKYDGERAVVTVGSLHAGTLRNIISDHADYSGILRTAGLDLRDSMKARIEDIIESVNRETGTTSDVSLRDGYVGVTNHDTETRIAEKAMKELLGEDAVITIPEATMTTEDFGFYLLRYPGCYYHIGVGSDFPLHNAKMCPDVSAIPVSAAVHAAVAEQWMKGASSATV